MFNNNDENSDLVFLAPAHRCPPPAPAATAAMPATAIHNSKPNVDDFQTSQHQHPYLYQQRTIEIIELVEVPPPTRREHISVPDTSSYASTSYCSDDESLEEDEDEDEDEQDAAESYCSSEEEEEYMTGAIEDSEKERAAAQAAFQSRMRRIENWRDAYAKAVGEEFAPSPSRTKRKQVTDDDDDDTASRSSKRSRTSDSESATSYTSLRSMHSCSACDTCFPDRNSLRKHGASPNEACRAAVEYDFEQ